MKLKGNSRSTVPHPLPKPAPKANVFLLKSPFQKTKSPTPCYITNLIFITQTKRITPQDSVKILQGKLDVKSLIDQLNAALSEEWLAYYQYWVGALVVEGAMRADVQGEFELSLIHI